MLFREEEEEELVADAVEDDPPPPLILLVEEVISISLASSMFSSACETPTMRLMVGVGREGDPSTKEKNVSRSRVKRLLLFYDDVGCWNNFFLVFFVRALCLKA